MGPSLEGGGELTEPAGQGETQLAQTQTFKTPLGDQLEPAGLRRTHRRQEEGVMELVEVIQVGVEEVMKWEVEEVPA